MALLAGCHEDDATSTVTASTGANLSGLVLSVGDLSPAFHADSTFYTATAGFLTRSITVTPTLLDSSATVMVNNVVSTSGASSANTPLSEGLNTVTVVVTSADGTTQKAYVILVTRQASYTFAQQAYAKASNAEANDAFGSAVALSGDTLAVAAYQEDSDSDTINGDDSDNSANQSGAVYVFIRDGEGTWTQQAYLKAFNSDILDQFGFSVTLSGDTLVVGAPGEASIATGINEDESDNSASTSGAAYVFIRDGEGTWTQQAYIKASNTEALDLFGTSVSLSGDTLAVGASREDSSATGIDGDESNNGTLTSGAVYVFTRDGGGIWSQEAYIKASNTGANDLFGYTLTVSGDTLAVGAYGEASNATGINQDQSNNSMFESGAVYIFTRSGTTWTQEAYIKASNTEADDWFSYGLALSGDTLAVSAYKEDSNATVINGDEANNTYTNSGAVYIFTRSGTTWSQQAYIKPSNTGAADHFGYSVALSGDTLAVGAEWEDNAETGINKPDGSGADDSGAAYVFTRSGTTWSQEAYIKASNTDSDDKFGVSCTLSGDTLVVMAIDEASNATVINGDESNNTASGSGAGYIFD